jgi:hypothetical protein
MPVMARAASVSGSAVVSTAGSGSWFPLSSGFLLNPGDRIETRDGRVVIDLSDGSMVVVEPGSVIVLKDFHQAGSLRELFQITLGKVRVKINHFGGRPNPYRMNSPTASIAVRGTEFTIEVSPSSDTEVIVYEGVVEVTSLSDPSQSVLVEAGRGVLVEAGQDFHMLAAAGNPSSGRPDAPDHDRRSPQPTGDFDPQPSFGPGPPSNGSSGAANQRSQSRGQRDTTSPRATASAYDDYIASLSDIAQMPFLFRFNAFPEGHLDSLENPAYATQFETAEARAFLLPTFSGVSNLDESRAAFGPAGTMPGGYSISPQISLFTPLGHSNFFLGGSVSGSRIGNSSVTYMPDEDSSPSGQVTRSQTPTAGTSTANFYSASLVVARKIGATSIGLGLESLRGNGSLSSTTTDADFSGLTSVERIFSASNISRTSLSAGLSRNLGSQTKLGIFYRYGFISGTDNDLSHTLNGMPIGLNSTNTAGHSSEIGFRLRGVITPRLFYGITGAWLGVSLADGLVRTNAVDSFEHDRAQRGSAALGLGYALSRRVILTFDAAAGTSRVAAARFEDTTGNLLQNGTANGNFLSAHSAIQVDLSRRLFVNASFLNVWHVQHLNVGLFPDQFGNTTLVQDSFFPLTPTAYQLASQFSDFGIGWRFTPNLFAQYLYSTDYGVTAGTHMLMLRYTFKLQRGE